MQKAPRGNDFSRSVNEFHGLEAPERISTAGYAALVGHYDLRFRFHQSLQGSRKIIIAWTRSLACPDASAYAEGHAGGASRVRPEMGRRTGILHLRLRKFANVYGVLLHVAENVPGKQDGQGEYFTRGLVAYLLSSAWLAPAGLVSATSRGVREAARRTSAELMNHELMSESYLLLHQTMLTPMQTTTIPIQRLRLMRSPKKVLAPNVPAA
jgi:hypothetical protein